MTANEYATLIFYWYGDPHPEKIQEILHFLELGEWEKTAARELAVAGVVMGLGMAYPDDVILWRLAYPALYQSVNRTIQFYCVRPEYADFLIGQWFILRDLKLLEQLLDRIPDGGPVGEYAFEAGRVASKQCVPFRHALKQAYKARAEAMVLKVEQ